MIYSFLSSRTMSGTCCLPPWTWKRLRDETKRMPSRPQYPFIGSLPSFKDFLSQNRINAYFFKCHQDLGPIVEHNLFGNRNISVADPVEAKKILTGSAFVRHDFLIANSPDLLEFALFGMATSPVWKAHRKAIVAGLGPPFVKKSYVATVDLMDDLIRILNAKIDASPTGEATVQIRTYLSAVTLDIIMRVACSKDIHCLESLESCDEIGGRRSDVQVVDTESETYFGALRTNIDKMSEVLFARVLLPPFLHSFFKIGKSHLKGLGAGFQAVASSILEPRKDLNSTPERDLVSILLAENADEDGTRRFSDKEAADELVALLLAGHETTANTLTNVFLRIAQDARVMERLQQEIDQHVGREGTPLLEDLPRFKYLDNVFRETQRVHPVVPGVGRIAAADTEIAGYKVKQGTEVFVSFTGLLGSEDIWGCDAAEFKPDRWDGQINELAFIPFGSGPHMCPGMKMAIMESRITLIKLLQNFEFKLIEGQDLIHRDGVTLHLKNGLQLAVSKRS